MSEKPKLTLRESLNLISFGYKTAHKLMPTFFLYTLFRSLITSSQPLIIIFFSARILNELNGVRDIHMIITYVSFTVGLTFFLSVSKAFLVRAVETHAGWEQALRKIEMLVAERYATMDFAHTEDSSISEMISRMDTVARSSGRGLMLIYLSTPQMTENLFSLGFTILLLMGALSADSIGNITSWEIYILFGLFIIGLLIGLWLRKKESMRLQKIFESSANINALADYYFEYVTVAKAAKDVRLYSQSDLLRGVFNKALSIKPWISFFNYTGHISGFSLGLMAAVGGSFYLLVGSSALGGAIPVGSIVQTVGAITVLTGAIGSLIGQVGSIYNNAEFIEPIRKYLLLPDILQKGNKPIHKQKSTGYLVEFCNVSFKYPNSELLALQDINITLVPGERLAVVGLNGSGKTTFVKLLCRLYDPINGEILLDGEDIKKYDYKQYISLFSVVFQDYKLFPLALGNNIASNENYNTEHALESLFEAGFSKKLNTLPNNLDTILFKEYDDDGVILSGGEAQKIAIARALYKDSPIVILDEPTAALDPLSEYEVYTTFDRTIGNKTAVFISHRLSSCRFCHRIAVFDSGKIVQLGTHEELLKETNGCYRKLWDAQAQYYT